MPNGNRELARRTQIIQRHRGDPRFGDFPGAIGRTEGGLVGEKFAIHPTMGTLADFQRIMGDGFIPSPPFYVWDWRRNVFRKVKPRRMNPLNFRALRRAGSRISAFERTVKRAFTISKRRTVRPKKRKAKRK